MIKNIQKAQRELGKTFVSRTRIGIAEYDGAELVYFRDIHHLFARYTQWRMACLIRLTRLGCVSRSNYRNLRFWQNLFNRKLEFGDHVGIRTEFCLSDYANVNPTYETE